MQEIHALSELAGEGIVIVLKEDGSEEASVLHELLMDLEGDHQQVKFAWMSGCEGVGISIIQAGEEVLHSQAHDPESIFKLVDACHGLLKEKRPINALNIRLYLLIHRHSLMLFIKGTPEMPRCGFTRELLSLIKNLNLPFDYFDILSDETVRQSLKSYSEWPTYPQVYVKGELVGGLDICRDLIEAGEFTLMLQQ